ncbi:hypothetical protein A0H76_1256 [Hepatospora eriocheir]|uniref:Fungal lipase-type domain-containing protein n=1 Tax=Hepatospora eriocheir TaxID=1081669 RepID=A0A1X0QHD2_9MICR|nr:hypothetical protein A0H76_1256 [Hepatospora eriocheir]
MLFLLIQSIFTICKEEILDIFKLNDINYNIDISLINIKDDNVNLNIDNPKFYVMFCYNDSENVNKIFFKNLTFMDIEFRCVKVYVYEDIFGFDKLLYKGVIHLKHLLNEIDTYRVDLFENKIKNIESLPKKFNRPPELIIEYTKKEIKPKDNENQIKQSYGVFSFIQKYFKYFFKNLECKNLSLKITFLKKFKNLVDEFKVLNTIKHIKKLKEILSLNLNESFNEIKDYNVLNNEMRNDYYYACLSQLVYGDSLEEFETHIDLTKNDKSIFLENIRKNSIELLGSEIKILNYFTSGNNIPCFMIVEKDSDTVVIVFKGTDTLAEIIMSLYLDYHKFDDGLIHQGHRIYFNNLIENDWDVLNSVINKYKNIHVTGHSLGGSMSTLFHYVLKKKFNHKNINTVTFASFPNINLVQSVYDNVSEKITNYIINDDIIPFASYGNITCLRKSLLATLRYKKHWKNLFKNINECDNNKFLRVFKN